jgi:SulP family sulfate permease
VVIGAVSKLFRPRPLLRLWRLSRLQSVVGWVAFSLTLLLAPHVEEAIILSVVLSMTVHLWRELTPGFVARTEGNVLHFELKGVLWFGSAPMLERSLLAHLQASRSLRHVVLHLGGLGRIDLTGAMALKRLRDDMERTGVDVHLRDVPGHAARILRHVLDWRPEEEVDEGATVSPPPGP